MKLINKLEKSSDAALYSGQASRNYEIYLRPSPTTGEDGKELKAVQRYYVFRLLNFTTDDRKFPFIVRNEHTYYKKDFSGNIKEVKRICCPTTLWARNKIHEHVDKDYCPICKFSFEQNTEGWKNYKTIGQIDDVSLKLSRDTERQWAAYIPVLVVSDPSHSGNNGKFRILRLAGEEGRRTLFGEKEKRRDENGKIINPGIMDLIYDAQDRGITVFNGEEGANIAILCEKCEVVAKKKNGEVSIDKKTGEPRTYMKNCVTDVRLLEKRMHAYNVVTEANIEKLRFDETYGVPSIATKDQLSAFLSENYLDNGATDADFGEDEFSGASEDKVSVAAARVDDGNDGETEEEVESAPAAATTATTAASQPVADESDDDDLEGESPRDAIARITKGKTVAPSKKLVTPATTAPSNGKVALSNKAANLQNAEKIRDTSLDVDPDELPF